jgi:hypothetical protein
VSATVNVERTGERPVLDVRHDVKFRPRVPPNFFGIALGLVGLAEAWRAVVPTFGTSPDPKSEQRVSKCVGSFLKVDKGLTTGHGGVQVMGLIPALTSLLSRAKPHGVFGAKTRSFIGLGSRTGITAAVEQQFHLMGKITTAGLVGLLEWGRVAHLAHLPARWTSKRFGFG